MIKNLSEYFLPEQEFYLQEIEYNRLENIVEAENHSLNCTDNIEVNILNEENLKILVTRKLEFEPEELFRLSVSFGANLKFASDRRKEYNWSEINMAEEFKDNGDFVLTNLMSRLSLLMSQITASYGQQPLILPPTVAK